MQKGYQNPESTEFDINDKEEFPFSPATNSVREFKAETPLWQRAFTGAVAGNAVGMGVAFIRAGINVETLFTGVLLRDPAIGTLVGMGASIFYPVLPWFFSLGLKKYNECRERSSGPKYTEVTEDHSISDAPTHERVKLFIRPSTSPFYSWDMRVFLAAQGVGVLGASIAAYMHPIIGVMVGMGIGGIAGTMLALLYHPQIARYFDKKFSDDFLPIEERHWFKESRHDVALYVRLFCGAWIGYAAASVINDPFQDVDFDKHRLVATAITSALALFSPLFFVLMRRAILDCRYYGAAAEAKFQKVAWYRESQIDTAWYARVFAGVIGSLTLALRVAAAFSKDGSVSGASWWLSMGILVPLMSPAFFALVRTLNERCRGKADSFYQKQPPSPQLALDVSWYFRFMLGAVSGSML